MPSLCLEAMPSLCPGIAHNPQNSEVAYFSGDHHDVRNQKTALHDGDARASSDAAVMIRESVGSDGDDDGDERMGGTAGGATDEATGANDGARAGSGDQVRGGAQDSGGRSDGGTAGRADTQTNSEPDHDDESGRA